MRAGLCPLKEAQRILKKYTKIEFGADVFVLRSQRAKKHRFNIRSVREEGMYLGLNIRQRGMVVRIGNRNYIRNNVVPKPKSSEAEEEDQEPLDEDDNDDSESDDDYYEEDDDEDEDDDDKDAESSRSRGECVYVYVVRNDVAVKRVFYGDNNSDFMCISES